MKWALGALLLITILFVLAVLGPAISTPSAQALTPPPWMAEALFPNLEPERITRECKPLRRGRCLILPGSSSGRTPLISSPTCRGLKVDFEPRGDRAPPSYAMRLDPETVARIQVPEAGALLTIASAPPDCELWVGRETLPGQEVLQPE